MAEAKAVDVRDDLEDSIFQMRLEELKSMPADTPEEIAARDRAIEDLTVDYPTKMAMAKAELGLAEDFEGDLGGKVGEGKYAAPQGTGVGLANVLRQGAKGYQRRKGMDAMQDIADQKSRGLADFYKSVIGSGGGLDPNGQSMASDADLGIDQGGGQSMIPQDQLASIQGGQGPVGGSPSGGGPGQAGPGPGGPAPGPQINMPAFSQQGPYQPTLSPSPQPQQTPAEQAMSQEADELAMMQYQSPGPGMSADDGAMEREAEELAMMQNTTINRPDTILGGSKMGSAPPVNSRLAARILREKQKEEEEKRLAAMYGGGL